MASRLKHRLNAFRYYLSFALLGFYLIISFLFLFTDTWKDLLPTGRGLIGLILLLFGSIRFYVAHRRFVGKKIRINSTSKKENAEVV